MNMKVEIVKLDNLGRGIGYINGKIIFVSKSLPGDILEVDITNEKKNFMEGKIIKIIKASNTRIKPLCPYFFECGGCDLQHLEIEKQCNYKLKKINELLKINNINYEVEEIIPSLEQYNYRNKISLKIVNKEIGFYENNTHHLIKIDNCSIVNNNINNIIKDLYLLNITNGTITIRINFDNELLLIINSEDKIENISKLTREYKIKGIILNNKILYGQDYLIDKINDYQFKVSYDAFFQVNPYICSKLFTKV